MKKLPDDETFNVEVDGRRFTVVYRIGFCEWTGDIRWNATVYENGEIFMHCDGVGGEPFTRECAEDLARECIGVVREINEKKTQ